MAARRKIDYVPELIRTLASHDDVARADIRTLPRFFSSAEEGTVFLDFTESDKYTNTLNRLIEQFGSDEISPTTIEKALQKAIFDSLDIRQKRQEKSFDERLLAAISELITTFTRPPTRYLCYLPLQGLAIEGLPYLFGAVSFVRFNTHQLRNCIHQPASLRADQKKFFRETIMES